MNETQLIEKLKENNEQAFKLLYQFFPKIRSYLLKFGATKQEAEDIYHDALFVLINKLNDHKFELTSSVNTFLFAICKYKYISLHREKKKNLDLDLDSDLNQDIEVALKEDQKYESAKRAFQKLEDTCKKLLKAFYVDGHRMKQIAKDFGYSSDKVAKTQKYRCLEAAKKNFRDEKSQVSKNKILKQ
jgi:RNA polymerase sigma factor (sigma-70 family)